MAQGESTTRVVEGIQPTVPELLIDGADSNRCMTNGRLLLASHWDEACPEFLIRIIR